jgi:hypothetical protein
MSKLQRQYLSPAMVVALIALFFAVGGVGYAQKLVHLVINGSQIKKGSIGLDRLSPTAQRALKGRKGDPGIQGTPGANGIQGTPGGKGDQGVPGPTASGYAQNQNAGASTSGGTYVAAVALSGTGGSGPLTVAFNARLHIQGVVSVTMNNYAAAGDFRITTCKPQVAAIGSAFSDVGPSTFLDLIQSDIQGGNAESTLSVVGELDVTPGTYDARIVCRGDGGGAVDARTANVVSGDAIAATAVAR